MLFPEASTQPPFHHENQSQEFHPKPLKRRLRATSASCPEREARFPPQSAPSPAAPRPRLPGPPAQAEDDDEEQTLRLCFVFVFVFCAGFVLVCCMCACACVRAALAGGASQLLLWRGACGAARVTCGLQHKMNSRSVELLQKNLQLTHVSQNAHAFPPPAPRSSKNNFSR